MTIASVQLAAPCTLAALDIDTRTSTGNFRPMASVHGEARVAGRPDVSTAWTELLGYARLRATVIMFRAAIARHLDAPETHIFPMAALRVYGPTERASDWTAIGSCAARLGRGLNGGRALALQRRALRLEA